MSFTDCQNGSCLNKQQLWIDVLSHPFIHILLPLPPLMFMLLLVVINKMTSQITSTWWISSYKNSPVLLWKHAGPVYAHKLMDGLACCSLWPWPVGAVVHLLCLLFCERPCMSTLKKEMFICSQGTHRVEIRRVISLCMSPLSPIWAHYRDSLWRKRYVFCAYMLLGNYNRVMPHCPASPPP